MKPISQIAHRIGNELLDNLGFENAVDLLNSVFNPKVILTSIPLGIIMGTISTLINDVVGVNAQVFIAFILLIIFEFWSGVSASKKAGNKFSSKKAPRILAKLLIYTVMIGILNAFAKNIQPLDVFSLTFNPYEFIFYVVLNIIIIQQIVSVLENLGKLGMMEANIILKYIKKKLGNVLDLEEIKPKENENDKPESPTQSEG